MARNDITMRVRQVGLQKSIINDARSAERVLAAKPISLKLDPKGFMMPLGRITGQMSEFQKSLDASAARVFAFGAAVGVINAVGTAFKSLVKENIELNKSLIELNSIFRLTSKDLEQFGGDLFDVARNTGQAFGDVAEAATEFSRQGLTASDTLQRLNDAMVLTRLSGLAAGDSVKYLTAAINGFNKEALDSTEIVNRLANVDAGFAVSSRDLAEAISRSGASAQAAKVEFNELLAIVTSVQQQTARGGAVIGNAFKTIFTRLQRSSVRGSLEEIGVATENANGSLRSATAILTDYARAYQGLTDQQRAYTAEQVAGVRQVNNLKALITDMSGQYGVYNRALSTANNTTDQATRRNEEYNKTIAALAHQTSMSVKEMASAMGELMMGPGTERVLGAIQGIADFFNNILDPKEGSRLASGFMKGLGAYIAGPGLVLIGGAFLKLFTIMGKLGVDAVKSIFAVNSETQRRAALEEAILQLLIKEEGAMAKLTAAGITQGQKEKIVLDLLRQQTAERQKQAAFLANLSGLPGLKGVGVSKGGAVVGKTKAAASNLRPRAEGHVPNFSKISQTLEVAQAIGLGASSGTKALKGQDRGGSYFYNDQEIRVPGSALSQMGLNSKGRDMILPTYGAAKQENLKKLGGELGISANRAEKIFMNDGFVPNFRGPRGRDPKLENVEFTSGKGIGRYKGAQSAGAFAPNVGAIVSQAPKGAGRSFLAKGKVGLTNAAVKKTLGMEYSGNYFADFAFPVGGLRQADFKQQLSKHFKFEEFVASLGFGPGNKPKMVHTSLEQAMDKVGRNQGLGRIFEAAVLQGLRLQDGPEAGTWDVPDWSGAKGKYTLGLPGKTKDVDVKYNIADSKGNKTMMTMFHKALTTRPYMRARLRTNILSKEKVLQNREGLYGKGKASGYIPQFAASPPTPLSALSFGRSMTDAQVTGLNARQLSNMGGKLGQSPKGFSPSAADFAYAQKLVRGKQADKLSTSIASAKNTKMAEAKRIIFGLTSPQTAGVIAPAPGLRSVVRGDYNVPGYGKVKMGYKVFGYDKGGPAASQMTNLDTSVRSWSKGKSSSLANAIMPGKHTFERFANEGGISGATGSIFETAVQMGLRAPAFRKQTNSFDFPRGSSELKRLQGAKQLFNVGKTDWVDASVNPMDKSHMFTKIFNSIALQGGYFQKTAGSGREAGDAKFSATGKKMPLIPKLGKGGRFGAGKPFTLSGGSVPNFAASIPRGGGTPFQLPAGFSYKKQSSLLDLLKNLPKQVLEKLKRLKDLSGLELVKLLTKYPSLQKIDLNKLDDLAQFFSGGFVPNFAPSIYEQIETSINTERALSGAGELGFDPRVGLGVYDPVRQGSLTNAINRDHIGQGQSLQQAVSASADSQAGLSSGTSTMLSSAAGFIPNFATSDSTRKKELDRKKSDANKIIKDSNASEGAKDQAKLDKAAADKGLKELKDNKQKSKNQRKKSGTTQPRPTTTSTPQTTTLPSGKEVSTSDPKGQRQQALDEQKKQVKQQGGMRGMMGSMAVSMLAPMLAAQIEPEGDKGMGALKGGLTGAGIGAMIPMMMGVSVLSVAAGAGVAGFMALKGAIEETGKSVGAISKAYGDETARRQQNLNSANKLVQAQAKLNKAYTDGDVKAEIKAMDEVQRALGRIIDPKLRGQIIDAGGDMEKLGEIIANTGNEAQKREDIANVIKSAAETNEEKESFMGARGSIGDLGMGDLKWWAGMGDFAGERISTDKLESMGLEAGRAVNLSLEEVEKAYDLLGTGTEAAVKGTLTKYMGMTASEVEDVFGQLDFNTGEVTKFADAFLKGEQEIALASDRMASRLAATAKAMGNLNAKIAKAADQLQREFELVSEGWGKMSKIVGTLRKGTIGADVAMGASTKEQAASDLMRFQEDNIGMSSQVEVESLLRDLLAESKDFKNKSLKSAYQDVIVESTNKPLEFLTKEVSNILTRNGAALQNVEVEMVALNDKEVDVLHELRKINVNTAMSLLELRTSNSIANLKAEGARLGGAQKPITKEEVLATRRDAQELFTSTGRENITSGAERGERLTALEARIEKVLGVNMGGMQSTFFKDQKETGNLFQMMHNTTQMADEIFGRTGGGQKFRDQMGMTAPAEMESTADQQKWLQNRLFDGSITGADIPQVPAGMTIKDFYEQDGGGVQALRTAVDNAIPEAFREKAAPGAVEAVVEAFTKNLLGMGRVAQIQGMTPEQRKADRVKGEKNILETQLKELMAAGKLKSRDIKQIFGDKVDASGNIKSTNEAGLSLIKTIIKDVAAVSGPEFTILDAIKSNTARTADLMAEFLTLEDSKKRLEESTQAASAVKDLQKAAEAAVKKDEDTAGSRLSRNLANLSGVNVGSYGGGITRVGRGGTGHASLPRELMGLLQSPVSDPESPLFGAVLRMRAASPGSSANRNLYERGAFQSVADFGTGEAPLLNRYARGGAKGSARPEGGLFTGVLSSTGIRDTDKASYVDPLMTLAPALRDPKTKGKAEKMLNLGHTKRRSIQGYLDSFALRSEGGRKEESAQEAAMAFEDALFENNRGREIQSPDERLEFRSQLLREIIKAQTQAALQFAAREERREGGEDLAPASSMGTGAHLEAVTKAITPAGKYGEKGQQVSPLGVIPFMGPEGGGDAGAGLNLYDQQRHLEALARQIDMKRFKAGTLTAKPKEGLPTSDELASRIADIEFGRPTAAPTGTTPQGDAIPVQYRQGGANFGSRDMASNKLTTFTGSQSVLQEVEEYRQGIIEFVAGLNERIDRSNTAIPEIELPEDLNTLGIQALKDLVVNLNLMSTKVAETDTSVTLEAQSSRIETRRASTFDDLDKEESSLTSALDKIATELKDTGISKARSENLKEQRKVLSDELEEIKPQRERADSVAKEAQERLTSKGEVFEKSMTEAVDIFNKLPSQAAEISKSLNQILKVFNAAAAGTSPSQTTPAATPPAKAAGFIPNLAVGRDESRALQTEARMGGVRSQPALSWSDKVAQLRGGDGRVVIDKAYQRSGDHAAEMHIKTDGRLSESIKKSAQAQGVAGGVPNFNYPLSDQIIDNVFDRLGTPEGERGNGRHRLQKFLTRVGYMESDYNPQAGAGTTSASGVFQFTQGSSVTGINRMQNLLTARGEELPEWASNYRTNVRGTMQSGVPALPENAPRGLRRAHAAATTTDRAGRRRRYGELAAGLTDDQSRALTLANFDQARGSDALLREVISGASRGQQLYENIHHTNPDEATRRRLRTGGFFNATPTHAGLRRALGDPRRRRGSNAFGFIPNFAALQASDFESLKEIGEGSFGAVDEVRLKNPKMAHLLAKEMGINIKDLPSTFARKTFSREGSEMMAMHGDSSLLQEFDARQALLDKDFSTPKIFGNRKGTEARKFLLQEYLKDQSTLNAAIKEEWPNPVKPAPRTHKTFYEDRLKRLGTPIEHSGDWTVQPWDTLGDIVGEDVPAETPLDFSKPHKLATADVSDPRRNFITKSLDEAEELLKVDLTASGFEDLAASSTYIAPFDVKHNNVMIDRKKTFGRLTELMDEGVSSKNAAKIIHEEKLLSFVDPGMVGTPPASTTGGRGGLARKIAKGGLRMLPWAGGLLSLKAIDDYTAEDKPIRAGLATAGMYFEPLDWAASAIDVGESFGEAAIKAPMLGSKIRMDRLSRQPFGGKLPKRRQTERESRFFKNAGGFIPNFVASSEADWNAAMDKYQAHPSPNNKLKPGATTKRHTDALGDFPKMEQEIRGIFDLMTVGMGAEEKAKLKGKLDKRLSEPVRAVVVPASSLSERGEQSLAWYNQQSDTMFFRDRIDTDDLTNEATHFLQDNIFKGAGRGTLDRKPGPDAIKQQRLNTVELMRVWYGQEVAKNTHGGRLDTGALYKKVQRLAAYERQYEEADPRGTLGGGKSGAFGRGGVVSSFPAMMSEVARSYGHALDWGGAANLSDPHGQASSGGPGAFRSKTARGKITKKDFTNTTGRAAAPSYASMQEYWGGIGGGEIPTWVTEGGEPGETQSTLVERVASNRRKGARSVLTSEGSTPAGLPRGGRPLGGGDRGDAGAAARAAEQAAAAKAAKLLREKYVTPQGRPTSETYTIKHGSNKGRKVSGYAAIQAMGADRTAARTEEGWSRSREGKRSWVRNEETGQWELTSSSYSFAELEAHGKEDTAARKRDASNRAKAMAVARANEALRNAGYTEDQLKGLGVGFGLRSTQGPLASKKDRARKLDGERQEIERMLAFYPDRNTARGSPNTVRAGLEERLAEIRTQREELGGAWGSRTAEVQQLLAEGKGYIGGSADTMETTDSLMELEDPSGRFTLGERDGTTTSRPLRGKHGRLLGSGEGVEGTFYFNDLSRTPISPDLDWTKPDLVRGAENVLNVEDKVNQDSAALFTTREKLRTGQRVGAKGENEYDAISDKIKAIQKRRGESTRDVGFDPWKIMSEWKFNAYGDKTNEVDRKVRSGEWTKTKDGTVYRFPLPPLKPVHRNPRDELLEEGLSESAVNALMAGDRVEFLQKNDPEVQWLETYRRELSTAIENEDPDAVRFYMQEVGAQEAKVKEGLLGRVRDEEILPKVQQIAAISGTTGGIPDWWGGLPEDTQAELKGEWARLSSEGGLEAARRFAEKPGLALSMVSQSAAKDIRQFGRGAVIDDTFLARSEDGEIFDQYMDKRRKELLKPKDYEALLKGSGRFAGVEQATKNSLEARQLEMLMDASKMDEFLMSTTPERVQELIDMDTVGRYSGKQGGFTREVRNRMRTSLETLRSRSVDEGSASSGVGIGMPTRIMRGGESRWLDALGWLDTADKEDKSTFIKNLIEKDELGTYLQENPENSQEMQDLIAENTANIFGSRDLDTGNISALQGNSIVSSILNRDVDEPLSPDLIDQGAREDRKAKYIKQLAKRKQLGSALNQKGGIDSDIMQFIHAHPERFEGVTSPGLALMESGQANDAIGVGSGTKLSLLASLQDGTFMSKFEHGTLGTKQDLIEQVKELNTITGEKLVSPQLRERIDTSILKAQGITLDFTGRPELKIGDFDTYDDFWGAKKARRDNFKIEERKRTSMERTGVAYGTMEEELAAREAGLGRRRSTGPRRSAIEREQEEEITARINAGGAAVPQTVGLAKGFIPNLNTATDSYARGTAAAYSGPTSEGFVPNFNATTRSGHGSGPTARIGTQASRSFAKGFIPNFANGAVLAEWPVDPASEAVRLEAIKEQEKAEKAARVKERKAMWPRIDKEQWDLPLQARRAAESQEASRVITARDDRKTRRAVNDESIARFGRVDAIDNYRGYFAERGKEGTRGSNLLPSLFPHRKAVPSKEHFSIGGQWLTGIMGRKLNVGGQEVTVTGNKGSDIIVQTESGEKMILPILGDTKAQGFIPNFNWGVSREDYTRGMAAAYSGPSGGEVGKHDKYTLGMAAAYSGTSAGHVGKHDKYTLGMAAAYSGPSGDNPKAEGSIPNRIGTQASRAFAKGFIPNMALTWAGTDQPGLSTAPFTGDKTAEARSLGYTIKDIPGVSYVTSDFGYLPEAVRAPRPRVWGGRSFRESAARRRMGMMAKGFIPNFGEFKADRGPGQIPLRRKRPDGERNVIAGAPLKEPMSMAEWKKQNPEPLSQNPFLPPSQSYSARVERHSQRLEEFTLEKSNKLKEKRETEIQEILSSRKVGEIDSSGVEEGDWDYRGYTKSKAYGERVSVNQSHEGGGEWFETKNLIGSKASALLPSIMGGKEARPLQLGSQQVNLMKMHGEEMEVETASGGRVRLPLRGGKAGENYKKNIREEGEKAEALEKMEALLSRGRMIDEMIADLYSGAEDDPSPELGANLRSVTAPDGSVVPFRGQLAGGFVPNFFPLGQSAVVNEVMANRKVGQFGVKGNDVKPIKLQGQDATYVAGGPHAEKVVKTPLSNDPFIVPAQGQHSQYQARLKQSGLDDVQSRQIMTAAQGFVPQLAAPTNVGIDGIDSLRGILSEMRSSVGEFMSAAAQGISATVDNTMSLTVDGIDSGAIANSVRGAVEGSVADVTSVKVREAFNNNNPFSEVAPPPTNVPRLNQPGSN